MEPEMQSPSAKDLESRAIGWIGAGKMGAPMIRNLMNAGFAVAVTEPNTAQLQPLLALGASEAPTRNDQSGADIVFLTLPNDPILSDVVMGTQDHPGLADILSPDAIVVEMSTVSPECSARVAERLNDGGIHYLRAPLSGSTALAENAALTILGSGNKDAWQTVLPLLEHMSARQFYLGSGEEARYMKLVLNTLVGATSAILSEALTLGESGGLSRADMMEVIGESAVSSPLLKYKTDTVVSGAYEPAFTVNQMIKDFTLISDAGRLQGVPLLTTGLILELYRAAANAGLKDKDFFALVKWHSETMAR